MQRCLLALTYDWVAVLHQSCLQPTSAQLECWL